MDLSRIVRAAARYAWPSEHDRAYLKEICRANAFDKAFYLKTNPRLRWLFRIDPARHYVQFGEAAGLMPNPWFSPMSYRFCVPDARASDLPPLRHFLNSHGKNAAVPVSAEMPITADFPNISRCELPRYKAHFAVVLHIFYPELWEVFERRLSHQRFDFDLYVTIPAEAESASVLDEHIKASFPQARVWHLPNAGRDILPFLHLTGNGVFEGYQAVCKLHSKRSPHRADGDHWRDRLVAGVLGEPDQTLDRLQRFMSAPDTVVWVADGEVRAGAEWWGLNRPPAERILKRNGLNLSKNLRFPSGSIYWIKPELIGHLNRLSLTSMDFSPEDGRLDGTTAHAVERLVGVLADIHGLRLIEASALDAFCDQDVIRR